MVGEVRSFLLYAYVTLLLLLSVFGAHRYYLMHLYRKYKNKRPVPSRLFDVLPVVTIQLPIFNEKYVIRRLIEAVSSLRYPRDRLEIQVLDDSTDETSVIAACECEKVRARGIDIKYIHRDDRTGFKAGALENGLKTACGEFIAIFDADFLPDPDFLEKTIHYFTDPRVGMVQARWDHLNRNWSVLTESQSILLDGHFMIEHTARNRSGCFFNFNGTAGIWRKSAIADAGGWHHDTLTEDSDLSYRAQLRGWQFIYLPEVTVPAELPVEFSSFKSQQFRWTKGSVQVFLKLYSAILRAAVPWRVKVEAFFHLGSNFAYLLMLFFCLLLPTNIILRSRRGLEEVFLFDVPVFVLATISVMIFYFFAEVVVIEETRSVAHRSKLSPLVYLPVAMAVGIGLTVNNAQAVIEALLRKKTPFVRTPKYDVTERCSQKSRIYRSFSNTYRSKSFTWVTITELFFAAYFSYAIYFAFYSSLWVSIPFLMLFQGGFLYTSFASLFEKPLAHLWRRVHSAR